MAILDTFNTHSTLKLITFVTWYIYTMLNVMPLILFLSVGWLFSDPTNLLMSAMLVILSFILLIFSKNTKIIIKSYLVLPALILIGYVISALVNNQTLNSFALGYYQRNFGFLTYLALFIIYIYTANNSLMQKEFINRGLTLLIVIASIYGYLQYFNSDPFNWTSIENPDGAILLTMGNINFSGALLGILSVVAFAKIFIAKKLLGKFLWSFIFLSNLFLAIQTKTLQSITVTFVGCMIFIFLNYVDKLNILRLFKLIFFSFTAVLSSLILMNILFSINFNRIKDWIILEGSVEPRLDYMRTGIAIWSDHKIFGVGVDQYAMHSALYRNAEQVLRDGDFVLPDKSHNVFIDHFANGGLVVGLLWIIFNISILFMLLRLSLVHKAEHKFTTALMGAIWISWLSQSFISPDHIFLSFLGFLSSGFITGTYFKSFYSNTSKYYIFSKWTRLTLLSTLFMVIFFFITVLRSDYDSKKILDGKITDNKEILRIVSDSFNPKTIELIGVNLSKLPQNCPTTSQIGKHLIEIDGRSSQGWFMYAVCDLYELQYSSALSKLQNSLKYDPINPYYLLTKAKLEISLNQMKNALSTLQIIKIVDPTNIQILELEKIISKANN